MSKLFYISSVNIQGFRGIKNLEITTNPNEPCVIIGPNNSGKSSLLDAIGLCLGSPKFLNYSLSQQDFWKENTFEAVKTFTIEVSFSYTDGGGLPLTRGAAGPPVPVKGVRIVGNIESLEIDRYLIDEQDQIILLLRAMPLAKAQQAEFKGQGLGGARSYARLQEIKKDLPEIWQLDPKNLFVSLYEWKSGPLQRLLKEYKNKLFTEEWTIDDKHSMPQTLRNAFDFLNEKALKTPFWKDILEPAFRTKFRYYLGNGTNAQINIGLNDIETWVMSEFLLSVCPGKDLSPIDCKRLGDGWQSLLRLIALELVKELVDERDGTALLLIEEPETYLHPHLRRKFRKVISELTEKGYQVFFTTHSPEMLSFDKKQKIFRLTRSETGVTRFEYSNSNSSKTLAQEQKLRSRGNHELIFSNKVILVEGENDQFAVRIGLEKMGYDVDSESVSIIDCGSVDNLPDYADVSSRLGIPWFAIHDNDLNSQGNRKSNTQRAIEKLVTLKKATDKISKFDNDLEDVLGLAQKAEVENILALLDPLSWTDISTDAKFSKYHTVMTEIMQWLS